MTELLDRGTSLVTELGEPSNNGHRVIETGEPYIAAFTLRGTSDFLFHRWNVDAVEEKSKAAKGSKAKKSDDVESYVYRSPAGELAIPGEYLRQAIIAASKYKQDPRSPRKSAADLFKAAIVSQTDLAPLGIKTWDYLDRRRVQVQRNGITRSRPAIKSGWQARFELAVLTPEYVGFDLLHEVVVNAGRLIGIGDFRPTFGRFSVVSAEILALK
jgi:hypothetical protein